MKNYLQAFSCLLATSVALAWGSIAHAITLTSSGVWTNGAVSDGGAPTGLNTNTISWGAALTDAGQSRYEFNGVNNVDLDSSALLNGSVFQLGTFTHHNSPIQLPLLLSANLGLTLDIQDQGSYTFDLAFVHDETPNAPACAHVGNTICPDRVSLPTNGAPQTLVFGGTTYNFQVVGFAQALGGPYDTGFITEENQANTTLLFGQLNQVTPGGGAPPAVPAPSTILASGVLLVMGGMAKQQYRKPQK